MKASLFTHSLALCALASSALASPLDARDNKGRTVTVTETDLDIRTKTKTITRTETETDTLVKTKTSTQTVVLKTTFTVKQPTTVTQTTTVQKPASTAYVTKTLQGAVSTKTVQGPTVTSTLTSTIKGPTVTAPGKTVTSLFTTTVPAQTVTTQGKTLTAVSTKTVPGPTITAPGTTVTSLVNKTVPGPTITAPGTTKTIQGPTITAPGPTVTSLSTKTIPGTTITAPGKTFISLSTMTVPGPTITDLSTVTAVSTSFLNMNNGTVTSWLTSACGSLTSPGPNTLNMTIPATSTASSSAAAATTAAATSYANVITDDCESPKAYYVQVDGSGTSVDGTVLLNGDRSRSGQWVFFYAPETSQALGKVVPQPFSYDSSSGVLTSYWNSNEGLGVYPQGGGDARAGLIGSLSFNHMTCFLESSSMNLNCGSSFTGSYLSGLRLEQDSNYDMVRVAGGYGYGSSNMANATFSLIPACDI